MGDEILVCIILDGTGTNTSGVSATEKGAWFSSFPVVYYVVDQLSSSAKERVLL